MEPRNRRPTEGDSNDDPVNPPRDNVYRLPGRERDGHPEDLGADSGSDVREPDRNGAQIPDATVDWNSAEKQGEPGREPPDQLPGHHEPGEDKPSGY